MSHIIDGHSTEQSRPRSTLVHTCTARVSATGYDWGLCGYRRRPHQPGKDHTPLRPADRLGRPAPPDLLRGDQPGANVALRSDSAGERPHAARPAMPATSGKGTKQTSRANGSNPGGTATLGAGRHG